MSTAGSDTLATDARPASSHVAPGDIAVGVVIGRTSEYFDYFVYGIASVLVFPRIFFPFEEPTRGTMLSFALFALAFIARPFGTVLFMDIQRRWGRYTKLTLAAVFPPSLRRLELFYLDSLGMIASLTNRYFLRQNAPNAGQVRFWDSKIIPVSRVLDPLLLHSIGRSVIAVYEKPVV